MSDLTYYAIGDVHGELAKLDDLLRFVREDAKRRKTAHRVVFLGDMIDRGPDSRGVVVLVKALCESGEALAVKGNHEELMIHAVDKQESIGIYFWAENGGDETILSYARANGFKDDFRDAIDKDHVSWLRGLPTMIRDEARGLVFVHGGIDPKTFPNCSDELRMWTRSRAFFRSELWPEREETENILVVHGHTPPADLEPELERRRINVDTGACFGGTLTAVVLAPNEAPRFLRV
ncbi:MAG: metallophosphoesterase family protein [Hyphomonadaceae bacterium]